MKMQHEVYKRAWQALGVSWQEISFLFNLFPFRVFGTNFSVLSFQPQIEVSLLHVNQQTAVRVEIARETAVRVEIACETAVRVEIACETAVRVEIARVLVAPAAALQQRRRLL